MRTLLLLLCFAPLLRASDEALELQLTFAERLGISRKPSGGLTMPAPERLVVRLGTDYFYVIQEKKTEFYDFQRNRYIELRNGVKVTDYNLSALVMERSRTLAESGKQARLMREIDLPGADETGHPLYELEARYGMRGGIPLAYLPRSRHIPPDATAYFLNDVLVCEYSLGARRIPEAYAAMFERYATYTWQMHPSIRDNLMRHQRIPERVKMRYRVQDETRHRLLHLEDVALKDNSAYTEALRAAPLPESGIPAEDLLVRLRHGKDLPPRLDLNAFNRAFRKSVELHLYSEALLCALEAYLQEGTPLQPALRALEPATALDPTLLLILQGLNLQTTESTHLGLAMLDELRPHQFARGHILYAIRGDAYRKLGEYAKAEAEYRKALEINPHLTAVCVNLGEVYFQTGRTLQAFICWDMAVSLRPDHPALNLALQRDRDLRDEHPEFFLPRNAASR